MSDIDVTISQQIVNVDITVPNNTVDITISGVKGDTGATGATGAAGSDATIGTQRYYTIDYEGGAAATSTTSVSGRVYLQQISIPKAIKVDAIVVSNFGSLSGEIRVGIYGPVDLTTDTPENAPLVVESNSVTHAGSNQIVTFNETTIQAGKYYLALQSQNATGFLRKSSAGSPINLVGYYDRSGGYGAFTDPVPSFTNSTNPTIGITLRCSGTP
jgi:hypothetical protein